MKLLASLLLVAPALAIPAPQDSASAGECADKTLEFKGWDIKNFTLQSTTSHLSPVFSFGKSVSELTFTVENDILGYPVECKATGSADLSKMQEDDKQNESGDNHGEFDGQYQFNCEAPEGEEEDGDVVFSFDEDTGELFMKQKWTCADDPATPIYYTGSGSGTAELDCDKGEEQINKSWQVGSEDTFSSRAKDCKETEFHVELEAMDAIA